MELNNGRKDNMNRSAETQSLESRHLIPTYKRIPVILERGKGAFVYDVEGKEYLDLISGIGVVSLGHAHPGLAKVIKEQTQALLHCSNLFYHPLQGKLAEKLALFSGLPRAFFCNSGTEAIEACLKFARRYWYSQGDPSRTGFVALEHSFHGRTMGSLSITWEEHYRTPFAPLIPNVSWVSPNDPEALQNAVTETTAGIVLEPIQGEGGVRPLTANFASAVQEACKKTGALLIADEVQSGLGRTGQPFYFSKLGLNPQLVALGKALGGGIPIGATLASEEVAQAVEFGDHGTTYGGNLLACRAALFFLEELMEHGLLSQIEQRGAYLARRLNTLANKHTSIIEVRGSGLIWGIEMRNDATPIVERALRHGMLINRTDGTVVRLLPPLTITEAELDLGLEILDVVLTELDTEVSA